VAKVIPQKVSEAKVSYVLYPFDRATTSFPSFSASKKVQGKKKMDREKVAEVLLDLME